MGLFFINCDTKKESIKTITTSELKVILQDDDVQLLDVRTPEEIEQGFIATAKFINYYEADFYEKSVQNLDKEKPVYIYCRSGNRSNKSAKILQENGYDVINVLGGYNEWKTQN